MELVSTWRQRCSRGRQNIGLAVAGWNERFDDLSVLGDVHLGGPMINPTVEADDILCVTAVDDRLRRGRGVAHMQRAGLGQPAGREHYGEHPSAKREV